MVANSSNPTRSAGKRCACGSVCLSWPFGIAKSACVTGLRGALIRIAGALLQKGSDDYEQEQFRQMGIRTQP